MLLKIGPDDIGRITNTLLVIESDEVLFGESSILVSVVILKELSDHSGTFVDPLRRGRVLGDC